MIRVRRTTATLLAFLAFGTGEAYAHGEATLKSAVKSVAAGASLTLNGDDFEAGESSRLVLKGALKDYELGSVTAKADSTFTTDVVVPADARPGQYRIVAMGPDGDEDATLDMVVTAAGESGDTGPEGMAGMQQPAGTARADEITVQRNLSGMGWGLIGVVIGLAGGLGVGLLRKP